MQPAGRSRRLAALIAIVVAGLVLAATFRPAAAIPEDHVQFTVTQSPEAPATLQIGAQVTFAVAATVTTSPGAVPLLFDFDYPAGLTFVSGGSTPPGVTCTNNQPAPGIVRCDYGAVAPGPLVPLVLTFTIHADATTAPSQAVMRAGIADGAPDSAADGDDSFNGAGALAVFNATMFSVAGTATPTSTFERAEVSYTSTLANNSSVATGAFTATVTFPGAITVASPACSTGTPSVAGTTVTCTGAALDAGQTLQVSAAVRTDDADASHTLAPMFAAPALGITSAPLTPVSVQEVGLQRTSGAPAVGSEIVVCTAAVAADAPNQTAAGAAQPNDAARMVGGASAQPVLQLSDFTVTGPGVGTVSPATGCGANQSGVRFTPSEPGTYTIEVRYNTGGTNTLSINVPNSGSPATKLAFTTQPGNGVAGQPLAVQPVVAVQTASSTTVTTDNTTVVTLAVSGSATLTCTGGTSRTVVAGVATFSGCTVSPAGTGYTLAATSSPALAPATSAPFNVTAAEPTPTAQLAITTSAGPVPRSRLAFTLTSGSLNPSEVRLVIRRNADGKYWDAATATWKAEPVRNPMAAGTGGTWHLVIAGDARRQFVNTTVTLQAFAVAGGTDYRSATQPTVAIR